MPQCSALAFILLVFHKLPGSVIWYLMLIWENSQSLLFRIFLLFLSLSSSVTPILLHTLHVCYIFCSCPHRWLFYFGDFFHLCSLYFLVFRISIDRSCSSEILSSVKLLVSPSEAFFIPITVFFICSIFGGMDFHISAYITHLFLYIVCFIY